MTQPSPQQVPFTEGPKGPVWDPAEDEAIADGAFGGVTSMVQIASGNPYLKTNPGLTYALANGQATPQQAAAVDRLQGGIQAQKLVQVAQAHGDQINLSQSSIAALDQMGVDYSKVYTSPQVQVQQAAAQGLVLQRDSQGNVMTDAQGKPITVPQPVEKKSGGGWSFKSIVGDGLSALSRPWNLVDTGLTDFVQQMVHDATHFGTNMNSAVLGIPSSDPDGTKAVTAQRAADMKTNGYDPSNPFSIIAYDSKGMAHSDLSGLQNQWDSTQQATGVTGAEAVTKALAFVRDPKDATKAIEVDPNLSDAEKAQQLANLSSPAFQDLVKRVQGKTATLGNLVANQVLDPAKNPTAFALTSAGVDLSASLALDPLMLLGKIRTAGKIAQVGLKADDGTLDANKFRQILTATPESAPNANLGRFVRRSQSNADDMLDNYVAPLRSLAQSVREGTASIEDQGKIANLTKQFQVKFPAFMPVLSDLIAPQRLDLATGVMRDAAPITDRAGLAEYLTDHLGMAKLTQGKAAQELSYMPTAASGGLLKYVQASFMGGRAAKQVTKELSSIDGQLKLTATAEDSMDAAKSLADLQAEASAAALTHTTAQTADSAGQLASAQRAVAARQAAITDPTALGEQQLDSLKSGWGFLAAARRNQAVRRLTTNLPRNMTIDINDPSSVNTVQQFARTYLSSGMSSLLAGKYAAADAGTKVRILKGIQLQVMHAAGYGATDVGRAELAKVGASFGESDPDALVGGIGHMYSTAPGLGVLKDVNLGGRETPAAVHFNQMETSFRLQSFPDLVSNAARVGVASKLFHATFGSAMMNQFGHVVRLNQLFRPATSVRNSLETALVTGFKGEGGDLLHAKSLLNGREAEIADAVKAKAADLGLDAKGTRALLDQEALQHLRIAPVEKVARFALTRWMGNAMRAGGANLGGLEAKQWGHWIEEMDPEDARNLLRNMTDHVSQLTLDPTGQSATEDLLNGGYGIGKIDYKDANLPGNPFFGNKAISFEKGGFVSQATKGRTGAAVWNHALNMVGNADSPDVTKAIWQTVRGDMTPEDLHQVIKDDPGSLAKLQTQQGSRQIWDDALGANRATADPAEIEQAQLGLVRNMVADAKYLATGKNGNLHEALVSTMADGHGVPSIDDLQDLAKNSQRPLNVVGPKVIAKIDAVDEPGIRQKLAEGLNSFKATADDAYLKLVESPIARQTSNPLFLMNYAKSRQFLEGLKPAMLEQGITEEVANKILNTQAYKQGFARTTSIMDDVGLQTQMDVLGRNFLAYSRATHNMVQRWGRAILNDPVAVRKAALVYGAAEHSGLIYQDSYGEPTFTYPGSGMLMRALGDLGTHIPIVGKFASFGTPGDFSGKVLLAVPGADNPFKQGFTPMVNVPLRAVTSFLGGDVKVHADAIDRTINGPIGAGDASIAGNFTPSILNKVLQAYGSDDKHGIFASSALGAIANVLADGKSQLPANPSDMDLENLRREVGIQTRNQLLTRAVLGAFAPSAPSGADETTADNHADAAYKAEGLGSLTDEYKQILNDVGGDAGKANSLFMAMHPSKYAFTDPQTASVSKGAYLPATDQALTWLTQNKDFIGKYKAVSAYFLPQEGGGGFNSEAYNTELSLGLRVQKAPDAFAKEVILKGQTSVYNTANQKYQAARQAAINKGDYATVSSLDGQWSAEAAEFRNANPLYAATKTGFADRATEAKDQISTLGEMVSHGDVPSTVDTGTLANMIATYSAYQQWKVDHQGSAGTTDLRTVAASNYDQAQSKLAKTSPQLTEIYNNIFRAVDSGLDYIDTSG